MTDLETLTRTLLALCFGAILGLETETRVTQEGAGDDKKTAKLMQQRLGGVRTYTILSLFGAISGILFSVGHPIFAYLMFGAVFLIVLAAYILNVLYRRAFGMTTEIAILITVLVGFSATAGVISLQILIVIIILLTFILSQKRGIASIVRGIAHQELIDVVNFGIVALVILPFLPNQNIYLKDLGEFSSLLKTSGIGDAILNTVVVLNPFRLWQYVVLISGFNLLGYFANRLFGKSTGLLFTGIFGGLVSSTSTIIALAERSKHIATKTLRNISGAGLIANGVSFIQILALTIAIDATYAKTIMPVALAMMAVSIGIGLWLMHKEVNAGKDIEIEPEPFSLTPAIKFAVWLTVLKFILQIINSSLGTAGFLVVTSASGASGMDAATISIGEAAHQHLIDLNVVLITFLLANTVNFVAKVLYARVQAKPAYTRNISWGLLATFLAGLIVTIIMLAKV